MTAPTRCRPHDQRPAPIRKSSNPPAVRLDAFSIGEVGRRSAQRGGTSYRRVTFLEPMRANILANRRRVAPRGIAGGGGRGARPQLGRARRWCDRATAATRSPKCAPETASSSKARRRWFRKGGSANYWPLLGIALVVSVRAAAQSDAGRHRLALSPGCSAAGSGAGVSTFGKASTTTASSHRLDRAPVIACSALRSAARAAALIRGFKTATTGAFDPLPLYPNSPPRSPAFDRRAPADVRPLVATMARRGREAAWAAR